MPSWSFLTTHARVLLCIAHDPGARLRDIAAQLPHGVGVHNASHGGQVGSCSREPPRGDQDLGRGEDAHHHSMGTCGAR